jgi:hypothetical protein
MRCCGRVQSPSQAGLIAVDFTGSLRDGRPSGLASNEQKRAKTSGKRRLCVRGSLQIAEWTLLGSGSVASYR